MRARFAALATIGRYSPGLGPASAEIVAFENRTMFVVNAVTNSLDIVDLRNPADPALRRRVDMSPYGGQVNSVDVKNGVVVAAVQATTKTDPGVLVFLDSRGRPLSSAPAGALPDMVTFSPDGLFVIAANEGEPSDDYLVDPPGNVTIARVAPFVLPWLSRLRTQPWALRQVGFDEFDVGGPRNAELPDGVRIYGPNATVAQDLEPEYATVDGRTAYVTLQENNAIAVIDLLTGKVEAVRALGLKDFSLESNGVDPSDRDSAIAIAPWPVRGMYQPDAIATLRSGRRSYLVTANEGDARDYDGYAEEVRVGSSSYPLDPGAFPNAAALKTNAQLGRLTVSSASGDLDGDGDYDQIQAFGARSFSVWKPDGTQVYDSGDDLEQITAAALPSNFNANNDENDFDSRSDNKGPEPEGVTIGRIGARTYAFVGLERVGGIAVFDMTNPASPVFVQYANTRDFTAEAVGPDSGPEGLEFVPADQSATRKALVLVANEVSGTVTVFQAG